MVVRSQHPVSADDLARDDATACCLLVSYRPLARFPLRATELFLACRETLH